MIDRDDPLDAVQLDGGGEIVPKCLVPLLEGRGDDADRRAGDDELAELAGQVLLDGISVHRFLHARIDAGQNHRLVVPFSRERETGREGERSTSDSHDAQKLSAMEYGCITAAARAQSPMQFCHCPSLSTAARKSRVAEWYRSQAHGPTRYAAVSQGVRLASAAGASSLTSSPPRLAYLQDLFEPSYRAAPSATQELCSTGVSLSRSNGL
jgi:hypothetical protein